MPINAKKILWPTDFSELSLRAGRYAREFAHAFNAELHVIHVVPPPLSPDVTIVVPADFPVPVAGPEIIEASRNGIRQLVSKRLPGDYKLVVDAFYDNPWNGICEYARKNAIDLIVVSTHGRTGLSHILIGSTAERVVQHAPCPVLTICLRGRDFVPE